MNAANNSAFASPHLTDWHSINWKTSHRQVRKLQVRIAKAAMSQQWRRVKYLQRMLTRSFSAKSIAVRRVTENAGKSTPGVDGEIWNTPKKKWKALSNMKRHGYRPMPLRRILIPKSDGTRRPLGIPTMQDRAMQALYLLALEPVSESVADHNSYGFRPMRSTADAIEALFNNLAKKHSAKWVLEGDIKGCFDNISHDWLLANIPLDKQVLRKWLNAGFMENNLFNSTNSGTPQGSPISPVLANMALDGLEGRLREAFGGYSNYYRNMYKINIVRYADDFVITGISSELLSEKVLPIVQAFMAERGLTLSPKKTLITHIDKGFDFLGQNIRKYDGKFLIKPSTKNLKNILRKIKAIVKDNLAMTAEMLIIKLNPVIKGWANYHQHIVAKVAYGYIDYRIWQLLWYWSKRRHPKRGKRWIKEKYFKRIGAREWPFSAIGKEGQIFSLARAADTVIKRHVKIRATANPYSPEDEEYFEGRLQNIWSHQTKGRRNLNTIWRKQKMRCPMCHELITQETGWHLHHTHPRHKGGSNKLTNLILLHPNCHRQLHSIATGSNTKNL
ncbi:group II intron reverse transcriptase/maturase [Scandinavium sp.]|uniref:group II intron reverse transcriptase/maturase n=1 Tax=Scandinavium sp. TaxID=2830653 RepID=UPI00289BF48D|nr:group II intron reverse transcriptase/maturase [Scandinavium sp.]